MPVKQYRRGTGLTKTTRVKASFSSTPTGEELEALKNTLRATGSTFEERIKFAEEWAVETLKAADLPANGHAVVKEVQSMPWYANEVLCRLDMFRKIKARITANNSNEVDELAWNCLVLGTLLYEVGFKQGWEADTLFGMGRRQMGKDAAAATKRVKARRHELLRRLADEYRGRGKTSKREIAKHIRRHAKTEIEGGDSLDRQELEDWTAIHEMSTDTIRKLI